jgi:translation initiation factor 2B subunit (eIF-2B alpha/beta/delta family)
MPADVITTQKDTHYSEEVDHLVIDMINEVREIYHLLKIQPNQVSLKFVNEFIPDFIKLYDLTGDHLKIKHPDLSDEDTKIRTDIDGILYYLDGVSGTNGHTEQVNMDTILRGIKMFRDYKMQLQREGIMVVY